MKILITGGAGFIGSHLCEKLLERGNKVIILDDLSTGSMTNIEPFINNNNFTYYIDSALNKSLVTELCDRTNIVIHLAAAVGVRLIIDRPIHTITTNVEATQTVLDAATHKQKPVIIASTSEVYGKNTNTPFKEEDDLVLGATKHSRWAYACSKALDEWLAFAYMKEKKIPVMILRFFNTVGPRQTGRYGMVLPNFVRQAITDKPITVYGSGKQSRCFIHVNDTVEAIIRLTQCKNAIGHSINIGSNEEIQIGKLAELVKTKCRSHSEIKFIPYEEAYAEGFEDIPKRVPNIDKLISMTEFKPQISLDEIVKDVIKDQHQKLAQKAADASI